MKTDLRNGKRLGCMIWFKFHYLFDWTILGSNLKQLQICYRPMISIVSIKVVSTFMWLWPMTHLLPDFRVTSTSNSTITTTVDYVSLLNNWPLLLQSRFLLIRMRVSPDQDRPAGEGAVGARSLKASGKVLESTGSKISTFYWRSRWLDEVY